MSDLKQLGYGIYLDIDQLQKQSKKAQKSFKDISDSAAKGGKSMQDSFSKASGGVGASIGSMVGKFASITAAIALFTRTLKQCVQANMDFERKSSELAAVLGTNKQGVKELTDAARDLGRYTEYTATQVEELQIALARLGFTNQQILDMQEPVLKFAQAVGADLGAAAAFAGSSLRAFGLSADETTRLLDVMAASTSKSALDFGKLEASMSTIAPVAHAFGLSVEDTVTFLGALANAGFDASTAATAMRNILLNLADANGTLAKGLGHTANTFPTIIESLKECSAKGIDLNTTLEMTDKRSVAAFNALISGAEDANKLREALGNCNGTLDSMSETMTDNLQGAIKGLQSAWEGLMLTFQENNGPLADAVRDITTLINKLTDFRNRKEIAAKEHEESIQSQAEDYVNRLWTEYGGDMEKMQERIAEDLEQAQSNVSAAVQESVHASNRKMREAAKEQLALWMDVENMLKQTQQPLLDRAAWEDAKNGGTTTTTTTTTPTKVLTDNEKKAIANASKELATATKDMWMSVNDASIAAMREGSAKKLAEIDNEQAQALAAIDKEQKRLEELAKKAGKKVSDTTYAQLEQRRADTMTAAANRRAEVEEEQAEYVAGLYRQLGDVFASEEQRKIDAIHRTYEEQRKQLAKDLAGGTISAEHYESLLNAMTDAEKKEITDFWESQYLTNEQLLDKERKTWESRLALVPKSYKAAAEKAAQEAISTMAKRFKEEDLDKIFSDLSEVTLADIDKAISELEKSHADLSDKDYKDLLKQLKELREQLVGSKNPFVQLAEAWKQLSVEMNTKNFNAVLSASSGIAENFRQITDSMRSVAEMTGNEGLATAADVMDDVIGNLQAAEKGAEAWGGWWGAIIGGVTDLIPKIVKWTSGDKEHEENIKDLNERLEYTKSLYDDIARETDRLYYRAKQSSYEREVSNLQRQLKLLQEMRAEEEEKKKPDNSAIKAYDDQIKQLRNDIADAKEAAIDALFGSDISSAIDDMQSAMTEAWASGGSSAESARAQVRKMLQQMVSEAVKAYTQASGAMERIRSAMQGAMADEIVTDTERERIEKMAEDLAREVEEKYGWASSLFNEEGRQGLSGSGIAASQESVDNLDARMTTMQSHTYTLVQGQQELIRVSSAILDKVAGIERHTEGTERELGAVSRNIMVIKNNIDDISLKGVKIRN